MARGLVGALVMRVHLVGALAALARALVTVESYWSTLAATGAATGVDQ